MTKEHVQRMLSKVPRGRFLEVEEFTSLICWLSSEENTFSTAAVVDLSGGRSTYYPLGFCSSILILLILALLNLISLDITGAKIIIDQ